VRCGARLSSRDDTSLQRVWAWLFAGLVAYVPANLYPMLETTTLGRTADNTLMGGVIELFIHGSYGIAAIVFIASIMIPVGKFVAIAYLAMVVARGDGRLAHARHRTYEVVEFIGRWSMIDVFVVAILSSLIQLGSAASVKPGIAALSFALSVAFTMLSAMSFDSRLIWDADKDAVA
jgi:paraquat-inducible protein A